MYCFNCGHEIKEGTNYCPNCGEKVSEYRKITLDTAEELDSTDISSANGEKGIRKRDKSTVVTILVLLFLAGGILAVSILTRDPAGTLPRTFYCVEVEPSSEAIEDNFIEVPMFDTGLDAEKYMENGFGPGVSNSLPDVITIECNSDNTFSAHFYEWETYGDYYYDKKAGTVTFYVDGEEYWANYHKEEGRKNKVLSFYSEDGSKFTFVCQ